MKLAAIHSTRSPRGVALFHVRCISELFFAQTCGMQSGKIKHRPCSSLFRGSGENVQMFLRAIPFAGEAQQLKQKSSALNVRGVITEFSAECLNSFRKQALLKQLFWCHLTSLLPSGGLPSSLHGLIFFDVPSGLDLAAERPVGFLFFVRELDLGKIESEVIGRNNFPAVIFFGRSTGFELRNQ